MINKQYRITKCNNIYHCYKRLKFKLNNNTLHIFYGSTSLAYRILNGVIIAYTECTI